MGGRVVGWSACAIGISLLGACTTDTGELRIRAVESASSGIKGGSSALAEAHGLLNLGNPGLALEAFRKIQRERPGADALAGIAACYVAMGRDDLARTNLEAALALRPESPDLLNSIALVMDRMGLKAEAANARLQARAATNQPAPVPAAATAAVSHAQADEAFRPLIPRNDLEIDLSSEPLMPATAATAPDDRDVIRAVEEARRFVEAHDLSSSVTVKLPPARDKSAPPAVAEDRKVAGPAEQAGRRAEAPLAASSSVTVRLPPARMRSTLARAAAPRLERLSPKEVALVTSGRPFWAPSGLSRIRTSMADARWMPLRQATGAPNIRLLNAARVEGLASAARSGLVRRGWRKIEVGDHAEVRARSIVLYPADKQRIGRSLARHFGIASAQSRGRTVTILIGRDLAARLHG